MIMVTFTGQGPGMSDKFNIIGGSAVSPGDHHACVSGSVAQKLTPGQWSVTATPNAFGAKATCNVKVPGTVTLDVSGASPSCK
jgi:hypothetical protein